jgi:hypothetical protein
VAQFSLFNVFTYSPFMVLGAVLADRTLGGAAAWGGILAAQGAGSIIGGLAVLRVRVGRPLVAVVLGLVCFSAPVALLAVRAPVGAIAAAAAVSGAGFAVSDTLWSTTLQKQVPPAALSRVSAYDWLGSIAFVPLGYALAGPLAGAIGISATLWLGAGWAVIGGATALSFRSVRRLTGSPGKGQSAVPLPAGRAQVVSQSRLPHCMANGLAGCPDGGGPEIISPVHRLGWYGPGIIFTAGSP